MVSGLGYRGFIPPGTRLFQGGLAVWPPVWETPGDLQPVVVEATRFLFYPVWILSVVPCFAQKDNLGNWFADQAGGDECLF